MSDEAFTICQTALRKAFIVLTEGEGYLRGLTHYPDAGNRNAAHDRVCASFMVVRQEIEAALLFRHAPPIVHQLQRSFQTDLFADSEL